MKTTLHLPAGIFEDLLQHLLPKNGWCEEAAFLFVASERTPPELKLTFIEATKLVPDDFVTRRADYLELKDETRARVIKRAHDFGASLIEVHSHVGPWRAEFSYSDIAGMKDIVPHLWWRLRGRPYAAIVVARSGFDALVWAEDPHVPGALYELNAGGKALRPTNRTLHEWP
jgi:hypothetical protein